MIFEKSKTCEMGKKERGGKKRKGKKKEMKHKCVVWLVHRSIMICLEWANNQCFQLPDGVSIVSQMEKGNESGWKKV